MLLDISHLPPAHGWLTVTFSTADAKVEVDASDVLNDPLQDLVAALNDVLCGRSARVTWFLEPGEFVLALDPMGEDVALRLISLEYLSDGKDGTVRLSATGSPAAILGPLCRLVQDVNAGSHPEDAWPRADLSGLEQIEQRLGTGRAREESP